MNSRAWEEAIVSPYGVGTDENPVEHNDDVVNNEDCNNEEDTECFEDPPQDTQGASILKDILLGVYKYFGKAFSVSKIQIIHGFQSLTRSANDIKLAVKTDLDCTWLKTPTPQGSDTIGIWPKSDLEFKSGNKWVYKDFTQMIPRQLPIKFESKEAEKYFSKKLLASPGKLSLPSQVFTEDSVTMVKSEAHMYEYWGRQGTLESEITHNLLDLSDDMLKALESKFDSLDLSNVDTNVYKVIKDTFKNLSNVNRLAIQSNYRCKTFSIVSCVNAKIELREQVLGKFKGNNSTKEALRGSSFFTDSLFGPLPTKLTDNLNSCSSRSNNVLSPKFTSPKNYAKRKTSASSYQDYNPPKRGNFNQYNSNTGRDSSNTNNPSTSKYATSLFHNRPHHPQRGRGQKKRGSKR